MKRAGIPKWILLMMAVFFVTGVDLERTVSVVDYFGGIKGIQRAWLEGGYQGLAHEIVDDSTFQNINSDEGFVTAMLYGAKLAPGGIGA